MKRSIKNKKYLPPIKEKNQQNDIQVISPSKSQSFLYYYWELLSLLHPIINLFEPIKFLKIQKSYIPITVKFIRIIFILLMNIFLIFFI